MPKQLHQRMREKGWSEDHISHLVETINDEELQKKHAKHRVKKSSAVYWVGLIISVLGNLIIATLFVPFLLFQNTIQVSVFLAVIGLIFGYAVHLFIKDIEHIYDRHHYFEGLFIPTLALVTVIVMVIVANVSAKILSIESKHNPWIVGFVYFVAFSSPYLFYKIKDLNDGKQVIESA